MADHSGETKRSTPYFESDFDIITAAIPKEDRAEIIQTRKSAVTSSIEQKYQPICEFASGGVGVLFKMLDMTLDRVVAVKRLKDPDVTPEKINRFVEECKLNAQLDHPSVVPVYALGQDENGTWQLVMKLINGTSMREYLHRVKEAIKQKQTRQRDESKNVKIRLEYFLKLCDAINYCHTHNIVHGDLKPENVMIGAYGELYVMDWGLAKMVDTALPVIAGTPNYLAPEVFETRKASRLQDIYAMGMILFELVTLRVGISGDNSEMVIRNAYAGRQNPCTHYDTALKVPKALQAIVHKATAYKPDQRYQNVSQLASDVRKFIYGEEVSVCRFTLWERMMISIQQNRITSAILAALAVLIFSGAVFFNIYQIVRTEQIRTVEISQRLKFQHYSERIAANISKMYDQSERYVRLYAQDVREALAHPSEPAAVLFSNVDYQEGRKLPVDMKHSPLYRFPVSTTSPVYIAAANKPAVLPSVFSADKFVEIAQELQKYNFDSKSVDQYISLTGRDLILNENQLINRVFLKWHTGECYSYPGMYESDAVLSKIAQAGFNPEGLKRRELYWSQTYDSETVPCRIRQQIRYPLFAERGTYLGECCLEVRMEEMIRPLFEEIRYEFPKCSIFVVDRQMNVISVSADGFSTLSQDEAAFSTLDLLKLISEAQFKSVPSMPRKIKEVDYTVSVAYIPAINGYVVMLVPNRLLIESFKNM